MDMIAIQTGSLLFYLGDGSQYNVNTAEIHPLDKGKE